MKVSPLIQPALVEVPTDPGGAPVMKWSVYLALGKINLGGTAFPVAFTAETTVTSSPLSADVMWHPLASFFFLSSPALVSALL